MDSIQILFADPFEHYRRRYKNLLEESLENASITEVDSFTDLLDVLHCQTFDLLIINDELKDGDITDNYQRLQTENGGLKIIMITLNSGLGYYQFAECNFEGFVLKTKKNHILLKAIQEVLEGKTFYQWIPLFLREKKELIKRITNGNIFDEYESENADFYFSNLPYLGREFTCKICNASIFYKNFTSHNFDLYSEYEWWYQCQTCGKTATAKIEHMYLEAKCECGGELRRDKVLFCSNCIGDK